MATAAAASELQKTWNREDAMQGAEIHIFPSCKLSIESYLQAQEVIKNNELPDSRHETKTMKGGLYGCACFETRQ